MARLFSDWLQRYLPRSWRAPPEISHTLWQQTLHKHAFLQHLTAHEQLQLKALCAHFLQQKEFTGAHGLVVTDAMALSIAMQACVLLLNWGTPKQALRWYDDFVGIVLHPSDVVAARTVVDDAGVVHSYQEALLGEAMDGGPITLSWSAIEAQHGTASNVVIHEFAHKLDMANGGADGCPPLPAGFMGYRSASEARQFWAKTWMNAYMLFCEHLLAHERFGQPAPWLDSYAGTDPAEFFAVACEAYWVQPQRFAQEFPDLRPLLHGLFQRL